MSKFFSTIVAWQQFFFSFLCSPKLPKKGSMEQITSFNMANELHLIGPNVQATVMGAIFYAGVKKKNPEVITKGKVEKICYIVTSKVNTKRSIDVILKLSASKYDSID